MADVDRSLIPDLQIHAARSAVDAGVEVRLVEGAAEVRAVSELMARVWGTEPVASPGPRNVLSAIADSGGYVAGAWTVDRVTTELVGASFGLTYLDADGPALRSQVTGTVRPRRGVGEALKRHQRAWAEAQGMRRVTWTFDPLVRTNAHFNVGRLGARIVRFVPDFYGSLDDGLNGSDETDRCVVSWEIHTDREGAAPVSSADLLLDDHQLLLASDDVDEPLLAAPTGRRLLVATPSDVVALRRTHPALARRWRHAVRDAFRTAFAAGLVADRVTTDGCYRFCPPEQGA